MLPAKIQISLRIRAIWSESSPSAFWIEDATKFLQANNEDCADVQADLSLRWGHIS